MADEAALWELIEGDCFEVMANLEAESVDMVVLDPPYAKKFAWMYGALAKEAARLLKPGGSLLAIQATGTLPQALADIAASQLRYGWMIAMQAPYGSHGMVFGLEVEITWKGMSWWTKGKPRKRGRLASDSFICSSTLGKELHRWAQAEEWAEYCLGMTRVGDSILDPMCGTGTLGWLAVQYGRRFVGIDNDPEMLEIARRRCQLAEAYRLEFPPAETDLTQGKMSY